MSQAKPSTNRRLVEAIAQIYKTRKTGRLSIAENQRRWYLYFESGRLTYAIDPVHRVRRWYRALERYCPEASEALQTPSGRGELWEYDCLQEALLEDRVTLSQARDILYTSAREVFLSLQDLGEVNFRWKDKTLRNETLLLPLSLSALELKQLLRDVQALARQWQALGLRPQDANRAPRLDRNCRTPGSAFSNLLQSFDGQHTVWDLLVRLDSSMSVVTRLLSHFLEQGVLTWKDLKDVPLQQRQPARIPTIACLDDSSQLHSHLGQILSQAGYRFQGFQDPVEAVPAIIQQKPDLLFLDLVMPVVNGYEVCAQLRRVSALQSMPIVILTGRDGLVDRLRARMVGASDFIAKPVTQPAVLSTVLKHLSNANDEVSHSISSSFAQVRFA